MEVKADNFIQQRLDSLYDIDCKIVSLLDNILTLFQTYCDHGANQKEGFSSQTSRIYSNLSTIAIDLRKEVKIMDENIGVYNKNKDNVMILPISVDQKNTKLGALKLNRQLSQLDLLLDSKDVKPSEGENDPAVGGDSNDRKPAEDVATDGKPSINQSGVVDIEMNDVQHNTNTDDKAESNPLQDTTMNTPGGVNDSFPIALNSLNIDDANATQNDKEDDNDDLFEDII